MRTLRLQGDAENPQGVYYEVDPDAPLLGEGGQGVVRQGVMIDAAGIQRPVAIKFLYNDLPQSVIDRARLEASIRIKHENLLEMLAFIELVDDLGEKRYHVVSELLEGVMLFDLLQGKTTDANGQPVPYAVQLLTIRQNNPLQFARLILVGVLSGLQALHDKGFLHRDIDPSNIMITRQGHIKLIDFGLVKAMSNALLTVDPLLSVAGEFIGKPEYAAPELVLGDRIHQNISTDLYSVGILYYQLITGKLPFEGPRFDILEKQLKEKPDYSVIPNRDARKVLAKALEKKQEKRYQSAAEFRLAIDRIRLDSDRKPWIKWVCALLVGAIALVCICMGVKKCNDGTTESGGGEGGSGPVIHDTTSVVTRDTLKADSKWQYIREITTVLVDSIEISSDTAIVDSIEVILPPPPPPPIIDLGYAVWTGETINNKPAGLGKMTYKQSHAIGDSERNTAQPGDVIEGQFEDGHWVNAPKWRKSTGETVIITM